MQKHINPSTHELYKRHEKRIRQCQPRNFTVKVKKTLFGLLHTLSGHYAFEKGLLELHIIL